MNKPAGSRVPDIFVVGAPKCASTSVFAILHSHPDVFMCDPKEPHYYAEDLPGLVWTTDRDHYLSLFTAAEPIQLTGEASAWYLFSEVAAKKIRADNPEARLIVCLRDPAAAAESLYRQLRNGFREDQPTFRAAWELQEARARGMALPSYCPEPRQLQYRQIYSYAAQIERLINQFRLSQIFFIIVEDLKHWGSEITQDLFNFLGVGDHGQRLDQIRSNERRGYRFHWIQNIIARPPRGLRPMVMPAKNFLNAAGITPSMLLLTMLGSREPSRPTDDGFLDVVRDEFAADIARVEAMLGVDLRCWCRAGEVGDEPPSRMLHRRQRIEPDVCSGPRE